MYGIHNNTYTFTAAISKGTSTPALNETCFSLVIWALQFRLQQFIINYEYSIYLVIRNCVPGARLVSFLFFLFHLFFASLINHIHSFIYCYRQIWVISTGFLFTNVKQQTLVPAHAHLLGVIGDLTRLSISAWLHMYSQQAKIIKS